MSQEQLESITKKINELKREFWGERKIIFHSRDIRKCQNGFEIFFDLELKKNFYEQMNAILFDNKSAKQAMYDLLERDKVVEYKSLQWER